MYVPDKQVKLGIITKNGLIKQLKLLFMNVTNLTANLKLINQKATGSYVPKNAIIL